MSIPAQRRGFLGLAAWWLVLTLVAACAPVEPPRPAPPGAEQGIEVLGVQLLGRGELACLNFRVSDYERARRAFGDAIAVLREGGDRALPVTTVGRLGPMRQRPSASGKKQFVMFTNAGGVLKRGDRAVLVIGGTRIPGIPVT